MSVAESLDPTSCLVPPTDTGADFAGDLRWQAGFLLGGVDWIAEQFIGYSIIAEVVIKPFAGDWNALERGQDAWLNAGRACEAVGANYLALPDQTVTLWTGEAGDAFRARIAELGAGFEEYAAGCTAMSEVTGALAELAKAVAEGIAFLLSFISDILTRLAVELAVPVLGWVAGAVDVALHVKPVIDKVDKAYKLIQSVIDAIETVTEVVRILTLIANTIRVSAQTLAAGARVATVTEGRDAAENAFGVAP